MQRLDGLNTSPCDSDNSYVGTVVIGSSKRPVMSKEDSMITGRGHSSHSTDSPTDSDEVIDHTAALLGFMEDSDEDDLREISGFSPAVSLDLELESIGDEGKRNSTFEKIFSGDELDGDAPTQRAKRVVPLQLNFPSVISKRGTTTRDEFQDNGRPVKNSRGAMPSEGKSRRSLADDIPFFYFDSKLVSQVEEYGQRKRTDIDNKRKQAALKAKALKDKAGSAISHRAKKVVSVPNVIWDKTVRKTHDDTDQQDRDGVNKNDFRSASKAALMKQRAKAAFNEKAKRTKEKMSLNKTIKERKEKGSFCETQSVNMSPSVDEMYSKMCGNIKLPNIPAQTPMRYMASAGVTVIGDMNKLVRQASGSIPAIAASPSNVSSNNSQIIDQDGFILSPTSSIDLMSSVNSINMDAAPSIASPRSIASPKSICRSHITSPNTVIASPQANRGHLPPSGKKFMTEKKDSPKKMTLKLELTKNKSHRRTTTASF